MNEPGSPSRPIVLCALEFERRELLCAGIGELAEVVCVGPGPERIAACIGNRVRSQRVLILAGLAGGLDPSLVAGSAFFIKRVIIPGTAALVPELSILDRQQASITASRTIIRTTAEKRALRERTGAQLVDLESASFAVAAQNARCRWCIVRGISDDAISELPRGIEECVDREGRTRTFGVLKMLLTRPWAIPKLIRLRSHSNRAMHAVCDQLKLVLSRSEQPDDTMRAS